MKNTKFDVVIYIISTTCLFTSQLSRQKSNFFRHFVFSSASKVSRREEFEAFNSFGWLTEKVSRISKPFEYVWSSMKGGWIENSEKKNGIEDWKRMNRIKFLSAYFTDEYGKNALMEKAEWEGGN